VARPSGRPGRERFLDMGLDNRLVADSDGTRLSNGIRTLNVRRSRTRTLGDGDTRRLARIDVVDAGCIIKGGHDVAMIMTAAGRP
jgi:hypothetical protein